MSELVIKNAQIATSTEVFRGAIGIQDGKIKTISSDLPPGKRTLDATNLVVTPGGVDSHCHIEQLSAFGIMTADDFYSGTVSAAYGGTTTVIPFDPRVGSRITVRVLDDVFVQPQPAVLEDDPFLNPLDRHLSGLYRFDEAIMPPSTRIVSPLT